MNETRMATKEVLDAIARERARLMAAVDALGAGASSVSVTEEGWTAKDVLAHLTHWAGQIAFALGAQWEPPVYVVEEVRRREVAGVNGRLTGEEWNALAVAHYHDQPLGRVRAELEDLVDRLLAQVRLRTDEQMNAIDAIPWAGELPLWQQIGGDTFIHWRAHYEAMERTASGTRP